MNCLGCGKPIQTEILSDRLCAECRAEHEANLRKSLVPLCKPDEDPIRKLYGPPSRTKPDSPAGF
jgi:hypothetical protein